jgi:hypothetical protein
MATNAQYQASILTELNCVTDTTAQAQISVWWDMNSFRDNVYLQYLYTKKHALAYLLGQARKYVNITTGFDQIQHQQKFENLLDMMKDLNTQIKMEDTGLNAAYLESASPYSSGPDTLQELTDLINYYNSYYWVTY